MFATTDEKSYVVALDGERWRGEGACGVVAFEKRIDQALAQKPIDRHLAGQAALGRAWTKGLTCGLPFAITVALKIGNKDIGAKVLEALGFL